MISWGNPKYFTFYQNEEKYILVDNCWCDEELMTAICHALPIKNKISVNHINNHACKNGEKQNKMVHIHAANKVSSSSMQGYWHAERTGHPSGLCMQIPHYYALQQIELNQTSWASKSFSQCLRREQSLTEECAVWIISLMSRHPLHLNSASWQFPTKLWEDVIHDAELRRRGQGNENLQH